MSRGLDNFNSRYVYRVLRPNEDHTSDLTCCAPRSRRTVDEHVATGLKDPSRFISTTSSRERALKWLDTANENSSWRYNNSRKIIVRIDVDLIKSKYPELADTAYDLSNERNRNHFLKTITQIKFSAAYSEVVFKDMIPREAVSVEYIKGIGTVRDTKAQPPSLTTVNPKSIQTMPHVYHEPYVANRRVAVTNLPNNSRNLDTQTSRPSGMLSYTVAPDESRNLDTQTSRPPSRRFTYPNSDSIQDYSLSVPSRNKPVLLDTRKVGMANQKLTNFDQRSERINSTKNTPRNYGGSNLAFPPATYNNNSFVPDGKKHDTPKFITRDLSYQPGYPLTRHSHLSTKVSKSTNTDTIRPTNYTGILRPTAKPVAAPRVRRDTSYPDNTASRYAELRPYMSNETPKVSVNSFPDGVNLEVSNITNDSQNDTQLNRFSFPTLIRRVCCFC